jgi:isopentenyl-diphosphate Delta-isomerase
MEIITLYDEEGNALNKGKRIDQAHKDGDWHAAVHVWIYNPKTKKLLIQKRGSHMYSHANYWDISAAGHVSFGSTEIETAHAEVKEELGLDLPLDDFIHLTTIKTGKNIGRERINNEFNPVYLVMKDIDIDEITKQKEEVGAVKWVSIPEFKKMIEDKDTLVVAHPQEFELLFDKLSS